MPQQVAQHYYAPRGRRWAVYRYNNNERTTASKVAEFHTREAARAVVYRLNGWKEKTEV